MRRGDASGEKRRVLGVEGVGLRVALEQCSWQVVGDEGGDADGG